MACGGHTFLKPTNSTIMLPLRSRPGPLFTITIVCVNQAMHMVLLMAVYSTKGSVKP